ncbi:MAG: hypothetical protein SynsKO_12850 [Synoicihabitans sp.]
MVKSVPVSFLIPVRNEASNLPRCLASIRWADEVVVVDSHSTDDTGKIANRHGATLLQFDFNGTWPKKKNWALENVPFRNEWVFILDADEVLPAGTDEEVARIVQDPSHPIDGYWINRRFQFMGKWLKHAYYPNWNLRLFRHRLGRYEQITDSATASGDNEVHEHIIVRGETGRLQAEMDHYAFPDISTFIEKHNRYSNWEARVALDASTGSEALQNASAGQRRKLKQLARNLPFRPLLRFCYVYFWQRGFLDGKEGFIFARLHGIYEFLSIAKTRELRKALERVDQPSSSKSRERILGVDFYTGSIDEAIEEALNGALVLAPSGPGLADDLTRSDAYRSALEHADINLTDSGFLLWLWKRRTGRKLPRISGLGYLRSLLTERDELKSSGSFLFVMPSTEDVARNENWLKTEGFELEPSDHIVAPIYPQDGPLSDPMLLERIKNQKPKIVVIAIGGGVQERLGHYLHKALKSESLRPGIVCIGAAMAFLNGGQTNIPSWADRWSLGWLFRVMGNPFLYLPRYWRARKLAGIVHKFGDKSPVSTSTVVRTPLLENRS